MNDPAANRRKYLRRQMDQEVGNAHRRYELDKLFVFKIPSIKGLMVLLLKAESLRWQMDKR
jgi:hypothetical protein